MANLYGVSNPVIAPVFFQTVGFANIPCPSGTETTISTSASLAAISSGYYYPAIFGTILIASGATPATSITWAPRIGAGADWTSIGIAGAAFPANSNIMIPFVAFGPPSSVPWQGAGSTVSISITAAAQAVTAMVAGTWLYATLYRAPDQ